MLALRQIIGSSVDEYRKLIGTNIAGLRYTQRLLEERREDGLLSGFDAAALAKADDALAVKKPTKSKRGGKKKARVN